MSPIATAALLVVAGAFFTFTMARRFLPLLALRREDRLDQSGARVDGLLRFGFGQKRMIDPGEKRPGYLHVVIFAAFLVLAARTVALFGMGFTEGFHLPLLAPDSPFGRGYGFVKDVMVLGALFAACAFIYRRTVTRPDRVTLSWEGNLILGFIAGLMLTDMAFDGAALAAAGQAWSWWSPAGSLAASLFSALDLSPDTLRFVGLVGFWLH